jgi:hypothetical protein
MASRLAAFVLFALGSAGCAGADRSAPGPAPRASEPPAGLRLEEVSISDSRWGPEKKERSLFPGERVHLRVAVAGLTEKNGRIRLRFSTKVRGETGEILFEEDKPVHGENYFRHPAFSFCLTWRAPMPHKGSSYTIQMRLTDEWEGTSISREYAFRAAPVTELTILNPACVSEGERDGEAAERPAVFVAGEGMKLRFFVLKFARTPGGKVSLRGDLEIRDEKGELLIEKTLIEHDGEAANDGGVMSYSLGVHRPGRFVARILFADRVAGTVARRDVPFEVLPLSPP